MQSPFSLNYTDESDKVLIQNSLQGDKKALEALIERHQPYIYNVAWKMVLNADEAWDITQDVLIKIITNLSQFEHRSSFRTWMYRIVCNHFLQMQKRKPEYSLHSFDGFSQSMEQIPDEDISETERMEYDEYIKETRIGCMSAMLLCLDREQRLIYILGSIFGVDHTIGAELLNISKDNYRKKLSRVRQDLHSFMHRQCGLVNKNNPCRCPKKTKSFIRKGFVNKDNMQFTRNHRRHIYEVSDIKTDQLKDALDDQYIELYQAHPFKDKFNKTQLLETIINNKQIREIFNLD